MIMKKNQFIFTHVLKHNLKVRIIVETYTTFKMDLIRIFYSITTLNDISSVGFCLHDVAAAFFQNVKTNKHCTWYSVLTKQRDNNRLL